MARSPITRGWGFFVFAVLTMFGVNDGRIVAIDPLTHTVETSMVTTEAALQGDITACAIVSSTKGFAIVSRHQTA